MGSCYCYLGKTSRKQGINLKINEEMLKLMFVDVKQKTDKKALIDNTRKGPR